MIAIGSGGSFATAAARALMDNTELGAQDIVEKGLNIAGDIVSTPTTTAASKSRLPIRTPDTLADAGDWSHHVTNDTPVKSSTSWTRHCRPTRCHAPLPSRCATAGAHAIGGRLRAEITPKNILMIGPTGVGKTEIARRLAKLANAPLSRWRPPSLPKWVMSAATLSPLFATWSSL